MASGPVFFASPDEFRAWLEKNHDRETELLVGFWKVASGRPSMTWSESVDQALCFGWIDGIRRRIDDESYSIRFTPRRPNSVWSRVNIEKAEQLLRSGLMSPAGLAAFTIRSEVRSAIYSYENQPQELSEDHLLRFERNEAAWNFFSTQPPSYRRTVVQWVNGAKQEATRLRRLEKLIAASAAGSRVIG